ncbi:MAG: hypothetical protein LBU50_00550 [Cellulomonas sp.]|jgi:hypothetical protein|nr:hypothetical protein [Cellulomonas sp.]
MREGLAEYVQTAAAHREAVEQLHVARAALGHGQWLPIPERHTLLDEIRCQQTVVQRYEELLHLEPTATTMLQALVDEALADVHREGAPDDPVRLADAVIMVLARPGRAPLPDDYPVGLIHLPGLEPRLTRETVHHLVAESVAAQ